MSDRKAYRLIPAATWHVSEPLAFLFDYHYGEPFRELIESFR